MTQPEPEQPAGGRRQGGQPGFRAGDQRCRRQHDRLRTGGGARRQDDDRWRGRVDGGQRGRGRQGRVDEVLEPEHGQAERRHGPVEPRPADDQAWLDDRGRDRQLGGRQAGRQGRGDRAKAGDTVERRDGCRGWLGQQCHPVARGDTRAGKGLRDSVRARIELAPGPARRAVDDGGVRRTAVDGGRRSRGLGERREHGHGRGHGIRPIESTRNRSSARPSSTIPSPPDPGSHGGRIRPSSTTSEPASRSCSRSPAVARPWSGGAGQRPDAMSGSAAAAATPAEIPMPVSNKVLMTTARPVPRRARRWPSLRSGRRRAPA